MFVQSINTVCKLLGGIHDKKKKKILLLITINYYFVQRRTHGRTDWLVPVYHLKHSFCGDIKRCSRETNLVSYKRIF